MDRVYTLDKKNARKQTFLQAKRAKDCKGTCVGVATCSGDYSTRVKGIVIYQSSPLPQKPSLDSFKSNLIKKNLPKQ